jgi:hypothetical protein
VELTEFYSAVAQLSFTLFGVWFLVVQLGPEELLGDPALRRTTFHVSLGFLIPGVLALGSLLAVEVLVLWRVVFALGGLAGAAATVRLAVSEDAADGPVPRVTWWVASVVYVLFVVVAVYRPAVTVGGVELSPLAEEGLLVTVQMVVGSFAAWRVFTMRSRRAGSDT